MGIGKLKFKVYADNLGQPISGASIEVSGEDNTVNLTTNSVGESDVVELLCPDISYSLSYQTKVRPYAVYDAVILKPGLKSKIVKNIEIMDTILNIVAVILETEDIVEFPETTSLVIGEHVLWGNYSSKIVVNPFTQMEPEPIGDIFTNVFVPQFITVHEGLPTNKSGANYFESYQDYIKNVATSEIYSTWPLETIKANILVIQSFALCRVFTEWYLSKGHNFTITTSTQYDQKYIKNRNIADPISKIVDSIFTNYLVYRNGVPPFFAQYCDGKKVKNPGWFYQWGSKDLGEKGYTAIQIIRHYYGPDVSIATTNQVEGSPTSYPGYDLKYGMCGEPVQKIQLQLNKISSNYPLIPKLEPADGIYKEKTELAVKSFQEIFDLTITGIVDFATWYKISQIYIAVTDMLNGRYSV